MLTTITREKFISQLRKRKLENISTVQSIERMLVQQRGYVFRKPSKGQAVILLLSGGLDSVTTWGILMQEFGLAVYPLSFDRGEKRADKELSSIRYFSKIYKKRYPVLYHEPFRIKLGVEGVTVPIENATSYLHPEVILNNFNGDAKLIEINISFGSFLLLPLYSKIYAEYLKHTQNLHIKTIFCSVTLSDGLLVPHQTFTALRSIMFHLCASTGDYSWQFASAIFEKELGLYMDKSDLVSWASTHQIPLEHSWSCYHSTTYQCGGDDCQTCIVRRQAFEIAGVMDKTKYKSVERQSWHYIARRLLHIFLNK